MEEKDKAFILIPAKAHSNRLRGKNMKLIGGKSLTYHAVRRSVLSEIGDVYLSTESSVLAHMIRSEMGQSSDTLKIIKRPQALCKDTTRVFEVCMHAIERTRKKEYTTIIMTLPSTPLLKAAHMQEAYDQFLDNERYPLFCITRVEKSETLLLKKDDAGFFCTWGDNNIHKTISGEYGQAYRNNGGIMICDIEEFISVNGDYYRFCATQGYEVGPEFGLDVDTQLDYLLAESIYKWNN